MKNEDLGWKRKYNNLKDGGRGVVDDQNAQYYIPLWFLEIMKKIVKNSHFFRDEDPVLPKKPYTGLCTSNEGRFLKVFKQIF